MNADLISLINFMKSHNAVYCLATAHIAKELLSFCFDNGLKIDAFVQPGDTKDGANFFGVPVYGENLVPLAQNCGWIAAVGDAGAAETFLKLQRSGIYDSFLVTESMVSEMVRLALLPNAKLKGAAESERCFLLCTGPSVKNLDLLKLKNEVVFSCSYTPEFEAYGEIAPKYYVTPAAFNDLEDLEYIFESLRYVENRVSSNIVFSDYNDRAFLKQYGFWKNKTVFWLMQNINWETGRGAMYDLTGSTPIIWTASVMMLKIAMYMGYKKIYLIGTDHNGLINQTYQHAYSVENLPERLKKVIVESADITGYMRKRLYSELQTFDEYFHLHQIAEANGIEIYNAAPGSILDEFPKVEYESLF
ncbi:MAG: hypothetical protein IKN12_12710 [Selenomonadaceae bacterium]|nr:hypothetical protein [Selenomonadaceae bacterium]